MVKTEIKLMKRSTSGFTLLELLVVVGILAALVALALPFYQDYVNQSKLTAAEADLQTYKKALAMYDQLETSAFVAGNFTPLIGKYVQDFRLNTAQTMPMDPWSNDYVHDIAAGTIFSMGPDGTLGVATGTREVTAGADDILVTWKPEFFVASARKVNSKTLELIFSRKVGAVAAANATVGAATAESLQKVSATVYRFVFAANLPANGTVTLVAAAVKAQDGRDLSKTKPDGTAANTASF